MSSFSFPLAAPDSQDIAALIDRAFDPASNRRSAPAPTSATAVIDPIRRPFVSDPVSAVIDAIDPNDDPEDIRRWNAAGRIERFVEHEEATRRRQNTLASEPLYRFAKLVDSLLNTGSRPKIQGINVLTQPAEPVYANPAGSDPEAAARPAFRYDERAAESDYQYGAAVNAVLQQPSTTGVVQLSDDVVSGVESGLGYLFSFDPVKFQDCKLEMFLETDHAMRMMAALAAACITNTRVQNPHDYRKDLDWARSIESINSIVKRMSAELKRSEDGKKFICESPTAILENKRKQVASGGSGSSVAVPIAVGSSSKRRYFSNSSSIARRKY